jgi:hypothetical protein
MAYRVAGCAMLRHALGVLALLGALAGRVNATEAYYVLVFGTQRTPNDPNYSHSFATFVRAVWDSKGPPCLEVQTVSWLPRDLRIRVLAVAPQCGVNLDLHATLSYACANEERVALIGPYQVERDLYLRAVAQVRLLESGRVLYKAADFGYTSDRVSNCVHALSAIAAGQRLHLASPFWGQRASRVIVNQYLPWVIEPCTVHPWVGQALGLGNYRIVYQ